MKIKSQRDFVSGVMFVAVGVAFAIGATTYTFGTSARPGPGYFPLLLGIMLSVLGAIVLFKSITIESEGGDPIGAIAWRPLLLILGAVIVFGFAIPHLGLVVAVPLLIIIAGFGGDEFHWQTAVITAVLLTAASYLIFVKGLGLTMPVLPTFITG